MEALTQVTNNAPAVKAFGAELLKDFYQNAQEDSHFYKWEMNCAIKI